MSRNSLILETEATFSTAERWAQHPSKALHRQIQMDLVLRLIPMPGNCNPSTRLRRS